MTAVPAGGEPLDLRSAGGRADRAFAGVTFAAAGLVLAVLVLVALTMSARTGDVFRLMGVRFFTSARWAPAKRSYGALAFISGTLVSSAVAIVIAVPLSIGIALFVTQVAPGWLRRIVVVVIDLLAVVPSVVFGLWGVLVFSKQIIGFYDRLHAWFGPIPVVGHLFGVASGRSLFTAGVILAIMIIPIITSLSREVIDTCPRTDREGALALGATRWEMITSTVLPHSRNGIVGAVMLGLGRAMGETIAAALVIGSSAQLTANLFASGDSLPAVIANQWGEASGTFRSALIAMALTVFLLTLAVNLVANVIVARADRRAGV